MTPQDAAQNGGAVSAGTDDNQAVVLRYNARETRRQRLPRFADTPWGRLRRDHGWSLRDTAERSGVNIGDLSRIERGSPATPDQARRLLDAYDERGELVPLAWIDDEQLRRELYDRLVRTTAKALDL